MKASSGTVTRWCLVMGVMTALGAAADPPPVNSAQGARLHGSERFETVNIPLGSFEPASSPAGFTCTKTALMVGGRLVGYQSCPGANPPAWFLEGTELVGSAFRAPFEGRSVKLTIEEARCHASISGPTYACTTQNLADGKAFWEYRVTATPEDTLSQPLCPTGSGFALAAPHAWSAGGELLPNSEYFTFACAAKNEGTATQPFFVGGGVIAKCIDWGYPPWATTFPLDVAMDYHQLCTRMATADYCGEGRSNTLDGTPLKFMGPKDAILLNAGGLPATLEGYSLEAVWKVDDCGGVRPLCLGKKRWDTLPLEATCVNRKLLLAPRAARPCDSLNLSSQADATLLVSYSLFIDRSLVTFKDANGQFLTTTAVTVDPQTVEGGRNVTGIHLDLDGNGVADVTPFTALRKEGPILSPKLPANIRARMSKFIKPLYRCADGNGRYLLTDKSTCDGAPGFFLKVINGDQAIEGFVYSAVDMTGAGQRRPLTLWRSLVTEGVYATSTQAPPGFTFVRELGYLPAVGQLPGRDL
ncbi:ADYC domain-containing protein [Corallococcus interemptor]|uniref:ADYC domain-containing protein n=1 Tax=Corallococcus interemptor TaxID=2316720 RepID=UPI0035D3D8FC